MTMATERLPATTAAAFLLKIGAALLIMFAATVVLVHAESYFSHPLMTHDLAREPF
jgi:hypothetical protein